MIHLIVLLLSLCGVASGAWFVHINHDAIKDIAGLAFGIMCAIIGAFQIGGLVEWWTKLISG